MAVVYSSVCETSEVAYVAYCLASYGSSVGRAVELDGRENRKGCHGGSVDVVADVNLDDGHGVSPWAPWLAVLRRVGVVSDVCCNGSDSASVGDTKGEGIGRFSGSVASDSDSGRTSHVCDETGGSVAGHSDGFAYAEIPLDRGKNYNRNKRRRERAKVAVHKLDERSDDKRSSVKEGVRIADRKVVDFCPSLSGSVRTVDTRTAEEIEAIRTLAARRIVENKVAAKMAELRLVSLNDRDKTSAVLRLEAARMEQRINDAKAKSQASFKKCDQSLKSLGSAGSAGEYALKQEVKKGKDAEIKLEYSQRQLRMFYEHATPGVRQMVADIPEPKFESYIDVFGDCPSEFDEEEAQAYYDDLSLRTAEAGLI